jgi:2-dehydro-3-deoxyphosphogluconate aldolase/(4S)-4-hydroxy-2-oxoglutarate aldolase
MKAETVIQTIKSGLVPVYYNFDIETCKNVLKACYDGGIRVFEFTNRGTFAHEVFSALSKYAEKTLPDMLLGAGSVIDSGTASLYMQSGAKFIVSPALVPEVGKTCNKRNVLWIPGCGSVTEIVDAMELGADIVKIFPASQVGGPSFVSAVKGPMPWATIMPTGGVSPDKENLKAWFDAGVCCVGMGSKLFPNEWVKEHKFDEITALVKNTLSIISEIRNQ